MFSFGKFFNTKSYRESLEFNASPAGVIIRKALDDCGLSHIHIPKFQRINAFEVFPMSRHYEFFNDDGSVGKKIFNDLSEDCFKSTGVNAKYYAELGRYKIDNRVTTTHSIECGGIVSTVTEYAVFVKKFKIAYVSNFGSVWRAPEFVDVLLEKHLGRKCNYIGQWMPNGRITNLS